ncbi:uncharacterized protein BX664DRAFT_323677 [Halteromyces radiatus]|uniref:uncharacterized protein n=1 Tax=Halteromyces radiatus TaxID=101107 RepID=UPI0022207943|nr:uncharacterized protein BX664DRAFT_323677 [Halteromyces radiatus]KAI8096331.1 hypothetical protein BX664DRAFT_323677 [Halteromyces radiatus]
MNITRDQALCMFFYEECTDDNIKKCKERFEKWGDVEICYNTSPKEPVVVSNTRIVGDPFTYRKYRESQDPSLVGEVRKRKIYELKTTAQVKIFLNEAFCCADPNNAKAYKPKLLSTMEIYETIQQYTSLFSKRSGQSFARWCSVNNVSFLIAKEDRNTKIRKRKLYVLDDMYYDDLLVAICNYLPKYKESILHLKKNGYEVIGYARKSPDGSDPATRLQHLQQMVNNLRERSLVDKTYVSISSLASSPFNERDLNVVDDMEKLEHVTGNTQDMLEYIQAVDHNVCLVSIDFAGLSSRSHIVKDFLEEFHAIKKIAIETFSFDNEVLLLDSQQLKSDNQLLQKFDCRKKLIQRSK